MGRRATKKAYLREWRGSILTSLAILACLLATSVSMALAQPVDSTDTAAAEPSPADAATDPPSADALAEKQAEVDRVKAEINAINATAEQAIERYNIASTELEITTQQMAENQQQLAQAAARLQGARDRLTKRLETIYKDGSLGFVGVILDTNSFNDFLTRFDMLGKISEQDRSDIDDVIHYRDEIVKVQEELESSRLRQQELSQSLAAERSAIEGQLAAKESVLSSAESEVAQLAAEQLAAEQSEEWSAVADPAAPADDESTDTGSGDDTSGDDSDTGDTSDPPPPGNYGDVASIAESYLGVPYVWGGASPSGFDCSGLVMYVFAQVGVSLPHSAAAQYYSGTPIDFADLQRGDLVFFGHPIDHVGIYLGGGMMIHAPYEGQVVSETHVGGGGTYAGACRI